MGEGRGRGGGGAGGGMDAGAAGGDHRYPDERPFPPNHHHVLETLAGDARETSSALGEESTSMRPGGGGGSVQ